MVDHDNTPSHRDLFTVEYLKYVNVEVLQLASCGPDPRPWGTPCKLELISYIKMVLKERTFLLDEVLIVEFEEVWINYLTKRFSSDYSMVLNAYKMCFIKILN